MPAGHLFVADEGKDRVGVYDAKGNFKAEVLIHDPQRLEKLSGIAVDAHGNVYTCSRGE